MTPDRREWERLSQIGEHAREGRIFGYGQETRVGSRVTGIVRGCELSQLTGDISVLAPPPYLHVVLKCQGEID